MTERNNENAPTSTAYPMGSETLPSWQGWSIRHDFMAPGNKWDVTHDCGWTTRVDLSDNAHAIVEAQRAHTRFHGPRQCDVPDDGPHEHVFRCQDCGEIRA